MSPHQQTPVRRARTIALCTLIALAAGLIPGALLARADAAAVIATPAVRTGVYRGSSGWGASKIAEYEGFVGHPVELALDFQASDSWANQEWPDWQANAWKGRTVVLGATGIFPGDYNRTLNGAPVGWAQAASGEYDAHWRTLGERLVATGQAAAVLRGAHEFNGGWFAHRVYPQEVPDFVAAWRRWVTIMRSVPGQSFTFDWNPTVGTEWPLYHPEDAYPGDAYVDHVALDVYDGWYGQGWKPGSAQPTSANRDAMWSQLLNGERGMTFWRNFAVAHAKHLSLPEWGLRLWTESDGLVHGGGDDPAFIQRMASLIKDPAWRIDYQAFWEDPSQGVSDPDSTRSVPVPASRAAYLAAFRSGGTPSSASVSSMPVPSPITTSTTNQAPAQVPAATISPAPVPAPVVTVSPVQITPTASPTRPPSSQPSAPVVSVRPSPAQTPVAQPLSLSCSTVIPTASGAQLPLLFSSWSDRSWAAELTGRTVHGDVFSWVPTSTNKSVRFRIDNNPVHLDTEATFDVIGGNKWWAYPMQTLRMSKGRHQIEIVAQRANGCVKRIAVFTVS